MIDKNIFNTSKTDYANTTGVRRSLFLGEQPGLFDTVNRQFPKIWENYKNMKSLDWDEQEFSMDFKTCNQEFKTRPKSVCDRMIKTLGWQWEADSIAARTVLPIMAPFISAPELQAAYGRITDNEILHASTYSEIVRYSFDDPHRVIEEVLKVKEAMQRLVTVSEVMGTAYKVSHEYALGHRKADQETYNAIYMLVIAMLVLERIQFMSSFAVTFAIGSAGAFIPIAKSVQKICQDEFEVHVELGKLVLANEHQTEMGRIARQQTLSLVKKLIKEVVISELTFNNGLDLDADPLAGLNGKMLNNWSIYSAGDVYDTLEIIPDSDFIIPKSNPLPFMEKWIDISKTQAAPQEQQNGQYKLNVLQRTDTNKVYPIDF
jgi:ribonucleoside-diphosphate reductase beta chain